MTKYRSVEFSKPVVRPVLEAGDRYLTSAHVSDGFALERVGDVFTVAHKDWPGLALEVPISNVCAAVVETSQAAPAAKR